MSEYCYTMWPSAEWGRGFIVYLFIAGFCIPGILITFFYSQILRILFKHTRFPSPPALLPDRP